MYDPNHRKDSLLRRHIYKYLVYCTSYKVIQKYNAAKKLFHFDYSDYANPNDLPFPILLQMLSEYFTLNQNFW